MTKISAKVVADSKNQFGNRLTSLLVVMPRYILAEFNTHRMFSRNSASSRAIPTKKMIKMVQENPFIPIAWQKEHSGMQGFEYYDQDEKFDVDKLQNIMYERLLKMMDVNDADDLDMIEMFRKVMDEFELSGEYTLTEFWLMLRDKIVNCVILLYCLGVTKQIANRLLEPFMWHTVLVSATEWENFFHQRCPQYKYDDKFFRSRKEFKFENDTSLNTVGFGKALPATNDELGWLRLNKGAADIHIMAVAESIYDAMNESTPKLLQPGEWHIVFGDKMNDDEVLKAMLTIKDMEDYKGGGPLGFEKDLIITGKVKIGTAQGARTSYTVVGQEGKVDYLSDIKLHDEKLVPSGHWSPMEHCARCMSADEYNTYDIGEPREKLPVVHHKGWLGNFRGFIQYRKMFANENITK